MRATILLGEDAGAREELYRELTALAAEEPSTTAAVDAVRRAVVAVLRSRDRDRLVHELDRELLGLERRAAPHAIAV
jgi:benzoyl-CoA reductase/2-hydroxyglutaryl-CoA dehydratase subunit BcrC/BadD/HgdB